MLNEYVETFPGVGFGNGDGATDVGSTNSEGYFDGNHLYYRISTQYPGEDISIFTPDIKDDDGISPYTQLTFNFKNDSLGHYQTSTTFAGQGGRIAVPFSLWNDSSLEDWEDWHVIIEYEDQKGNQETLNSRDWLSLVRTELDEPPSQGKPTDIFLDPSYFPENLPKFSTASTIYTSDPDDDDSHTYALAPGYGETDNHLFSIVNHSQPIDIPDSIGIFPPPDGMEEIPPFNMPSELVLNGIADYETKPTYKIRLKSTDESGLSYEKVFMISVLDIDETPENSAPTDLRVSPSTFDENIPAGTAVGSLISTDPDSGDTFTYALVAGTSDADNAAFTIVGNQLKINESPDYETKSTYSIRVRTTDAGGLFHEDALTLSVNDLDETEEKDESNTWEGSFGNDSFFGGYEDIADIAYGYGGDDELYGGGGSDQLYGGNDQDLISGDEGDDELYGESGDDTLIGGSGQDLIDGGTGRDRLDYGNGWLPGFLFDTYGSQGITVDLRAGSAIGYSAGLQPLFEDGFPPAGDPDFGGMTPGIPGVGGGTPPNPNYGFADGAEIGFDSLIGIEDVITADGDDKIFGNDEDNAIDAGGGDDLIEGNGGNDQLVGGQGNDSLDGGLGTDEAIYSGVRENYSVAHDPEASTVTITDSRQYHDGTDTITGVELFRFADITLTLDELISSSSSQSTLDFTGDGEVDETDALLMMRHMMGTFPGDAITQGIPGITDVNGLRDKIMKTMEESSALGGGGRLDIDGDGLINPFSDGMMILKHIHSKGIETPGGLPEMPEFIKNPMRDMNQMQTHLEDLIGF